jgi:NAD(P)-dependent dehydrogenase (short-subunit alcohol dehydrogenase family)
MVANNCRIWPVGYTFNNAGIEVPLLLQRLLRGKLGQNIGVNLKGVWLCMKCDHSTQTREEGAIVNCLRLLGAWVCRATAAWQVNT